MRFNSKSVLLQGGIQIKMNVYIPAFLLDYTITDEVWQVAIDNFNKLLDTRPSVTLKIDGIIVDVLRVESIKNSASQLKMGAIVLLVVAKEEDVTKLASMHLSLTGSVIFTLDTDKEVEEMIIKNITYGEPESRTHKILPEKD